jgi:hypothetical protein
MKTSVVNVRNEACDRYIGRPSKWGNPFVVGKNGTREEVIEKYRLFITGNDIFIKSLEELRGMKLGCYCKPLACHGDVLVELIEGAPAKEIAPPVKVINAFIGGSRSIQELSLRHLDFVAAVMAKGHHILIGDAPGVDTAVQNYLALKRYQNVTVYHSGPKCRVNSGSWVMYEVVTNVDYATGRYYGDKDKAMALVCDYGLMFHDGSSKGTSDNIERLKSSSKKCLVLKGGELCVA